MTIRTRMAPSPTGNLHLGTARTTLFNWLFARHHGGEFILRVEDTDIERSTKEFENNIVEGLKWLGLNWDNAQIYRQSERLDLYEEYLVKLLDEGKAFWCYHTKEELEAEQKEQMEKKEPPRHVCGHKRQETSDKRQGGKEGIIRLRVDENSKRKISWDDEVRGKIEFEEGLLGDFSLAKGLRIPLYNFAVVVDDITMEISHVIRGEDHISNTPKQLLIYEALGKTPPVFAHLSMILGPDKTKLSKRHGSTSVSEYMKDYLPEAMVNCMGFLGYTYGKEILSKEEMAKEFELTKVHKAGAVFDIKKLNWLNAQYIRQMPTEEFKKLIGKEDLPDSAVPVITERLEKLSDVGSFDYLWKEPRYEAELLSWKGHSLEDARMALESTEDFLKEAEWENEAGIKEGLDKVAENISGEIGLPKMDRGLVYWPLRVALSGKEKSPDPVSIMKVIGKDKTLSRIQGALGFLE